MPAPSPATNRAGSAERPQPSTTGDSDTWSGVPAHRQPGRAHGLQIGGHAEMHQQQVGGDDLAGPSAGDPHRRKPVGSQGRQAPHAVHLPNPVAAHGVPAAHNPCAASGRPRNAGAQRRRPAIVPLVRSSPPLRQHRHRRPTVAPRPAAATGRFPPAPPGRSAAAPPAFIMVCTAPAVMTPGNVQPGNATGTFDGAGGQHHAPGLYRTARRAIQQGARPEAPKPGCPADIPRPEPPEIGDQLAAGRIVGAENGALRVGHCFRPNGRSARQARAAHPPRRCRAPIRRPWPPPRVRPARRQRSQRHAAVPPPRLTCIPWRSRIRQVWQSLTAVHGGEAFVACAHHAVWPTRRPISRGTADRIAAGQQQRSGDAASPRGQGWPAVYDEA